MIQPASKASGPALTSTAADLPALDVLPGTLPGALPELQPDLHLLGAAPQYAAPNGLRGVWQRWCQQQVINAFAAMGKGSLLLTLPDGSQRQFGQANDPYQACLTVLDAAFFERILLYGHVGFGEAYVDGLCDSPDIEQFLKWVLLNVQQAAFLQGARNASWRFNLLGALNRLAHRLKDNSVRNSKKNIRAHYDLSNDFFELMLDSTMMYSSGLYDLPVEPGYDACASSSPTDEAALTRAQIKKIDRLCQRLRLSPQDHVLEIGSGWGGFACYAAKNYGCRVTSITISEAQFVYAQAKAAAEGLTHRVTFKLQDYRQTEGTFDKIVSIEMVEALGERYFDVFFARCTALLKPKGTMGLQMIICPDARYDVLKSNVDFIQKHIFPGSLLPSLGRVNQALARCGTLQLFDLKDFGPSYAVTLRAWQSRFNQNAENIKQLGFDTAFMRKWRYYLSYCAAAFQMRHISVVQAIYTRPDNDLL
ncbi:MAG: cyclopropane-fatty-acyl-phospholipid synthase family protein [Vampirovibrionales bacterium]|nr:cyclopropane-fatty-acyl-phospholipid synthase family protein [Vampirovibrionales bacterium]